MGEVLNFGVLGRMGHKDTLRAVVQWEGSPALGCQLCWGSRLMREKQ